MDGLPLLTPSCVTAGKEHSVVIEFPRNLPALLVTLDFYYESTGKKHGSVPVVILGPKTVRAKFPEFPKPGEVEIVVKIRHEESSLFPKFKLHVQSPIEAIYHNVPISKASSRSAVLATVLAYLLHGDESQRDRETRSHIDIILCNILQSLSDMPHWDLTSILSGKHGHDENLLHFCMRHKLDGMATLLLQPNNIEGKVYYLQQRGYDNKTPIEIARKNDMKRITEIAQGILSEYESQPSGKHSRPSTPDLKKRRKGNVKRTKSMDTQLSDLGPLPLYLEKKKLRKQYEGEKGILPSWQTYLQKLSVQESGSKKGGKLAEKLKFKIMRRKSKDVHKISSPQPPLLKELDNSEVREVLQKDRHSHLLNEELGDTLPASVMEKGDDPGMGVGSDAELASPVPIAEHVPLPLPRIAVSHSASGFECGSLPATLDRLSAIPGFGDEDVFTGTYDPTALPSPSAIETRPAVSGLKKKSLYTAVVTKHYCWASPPYGDIILREGDKVYVMKEEEGMCLGICNNCFGKFPKNILKPLSTDEEATPESKDETAYTGSDSDSVTYDEVDPDEGYYKVPRNIVRVSESDSDSDHLYDYVPEEYQLERLKHLPEGHYLIVRPRRPTDTPLVPARLLPGYADASSHDTGLDRLETQYSEQRHTGNKAETLGAGSTLKKSYENVVLNRSPSEPVGINELAGSECHFIAAPHTNQEEMESTKSCEHILQEENTIQSQPENENTDSMQESVTPTTVSEPKLVNANTITVSNDGKVDEEAPDDLAIVKEELCDVKPSPLPVPGGSPVASEEEHGSSTDHQMLDTSSQEPTEAENTEGAVKDVIAKSSPTPPKRTLLSPKRESPVPKPRPKKRPLSNLISQKHEVASQSIPTENGAPSTKPMEECPEMQAGETRDSPPSPKPSQTSQLSSPVPVDKREIEAPGPQALQKTAPPPIPPKPSTSQKAGKEGAKA